MNPESAPTSQQPSSPEERKQKIGQLQAELQAMSQDDSSRGKKLKELISLVEEDEEYERGEMPTVPDNLDATSKDPAPVAETPIENIQFAQVKEEPQQN